MDRVTQFLLTLFGDEAEVVVDRDGQPTHIRISIPISSAPEALADGLKLLQSDTEGSNDVHAPTPPARPTRRAGGY